MKIIENKLPIVLVPAVRFRFGFGSVSDLTEKVQRIVDRIDILPINQDRLPQKLFEKT